MEEEEEEEEEEELEIQEGLVDSSRHVHAKGHHDVGLLV